MPPVLSSITCISAYSLVRVIWHIASEVILTPEDSAMPTNVYLLTSFSFPIPLGNLLINYRNASNSRIFLTTPFAGITALSKSVFGIFSFNAYYQLSELYCRIRQHPAYITLFILRAARIL